jgi:CBS domain-containing protein
VYRWNRACYGITSGRPHLRIENRMLPAGPTVVDEIANAAFWFGLISALSHAFDDITRCMRFEDAKANFRTAARLGLAAHYTWLDGETLPATSLVCDRLLPLARDALLRRGIDRGDVERYLAVIDARVRTGRTGARWITASLDRTLDRRHVSDRLGALTAAMIERQKTEEPVSGWEPATLDRVGDWRRSPSRVEQYMTTDLFTVSGDESVDLVASLMEWKRIRHVPVEDERHRLIGLISYRSLLSLLARGLAGQEPQHLTASDLMKRDPVTIAPQASTLEAIELMRRHRISCLPVVSDGQLVGIVSERDLMNLAADLLTRQPAGD